MLSTFCSFFCPNLNLPAYMSDAPKSSSFNFYLITSCYSIDDLVSMKLKKMSIVFLDTSKSEASTMQEKQQFSKSLMEKILIPYLQP